MTWKKKIAGTAAMFILGFIFILPVLWIVMNSIKTSPEIAADCIVCRRFRNLTSSWENLTESVSVFCFRTDRAVSCSYDSHFCTCYKYQSYQFSWRNYHS